MKKLLCVLIIAVIVCTGAVCAAETYNDEADSPDTDLKPDNAQSDEPYEVRTEEEVVAYTVDFKNPTVTVIKNNYAYVWNPATLKYDKPYPVADSYRLSVSSEGKIAVVTNYSNVAIRVGVTFTPGYGSDGTFSSLYKSLELSSAFELAAATGGAPSSGTLSFNASKLKAGLDTAEMRLLYEKLEQLSDKSIGTFSLVVTVISGD